MLSCDGLVCALGPVCAVGSRNRCETVYAQVKRTRMRDSPARCREPHWDSVASAG